MKAKIEIYAEMDLPDHFWELPKKEQIIFVVDILHSMGDLSKVDLFWRDINIKSE